MRHVLITGATGLIGSELVKRLQAKGHRVSILTRTPQKTTLTDAYYWNIDKQEIDETCVLGVDSIIHLAGENIGASRWTKKRKTEIINSRTESIKLLYKAIEKTKTPINTIISASAIGYYGDRGNELLKEDSAPGIGFLPESCIQWEQAVDAGNKFCNRIIKIRIGLLLARNGGALPQLKKPLKYYLSSPMGTGKQWASWIHMNDLQSIFMETLEDQRYNGVYNACAPNPVTNYELIKSLARLMKRPLLPINIPTFVLNIAMGEMSSLVLDSTKVSSQKMTAMGFDFKYHNLEKALIDLL